MNVLDTSCKNRCRTGAVLVWLLLSLSVLIGILAINLDGGRMFEERRRVQSAADAAALAAGTLLYSQYGTAFGADPNNEAAGAAREIAAANQIAETEIAVQIPPQSGNFKGQAGYVEILIQREIPATFGKIFTQDNLTIRARAVARGKPMGTGLNPTHSPDVRIVE